jgi:hypothetical protein
MSDHPEFVEIKARHKAEIDELTTAFGVKYSELVSAEPHLRDGAAVEALRKKHRTDIQEAISRHTMAENAWREPAAEQVEPARFVGNATTLDKPKAD